jgi:hypothetical protein
MHRRFNEATNVDVLAFHEGFADIVALMQHFTMREVLSQEIARTRGDIEAESILGSLAVQFGRATGSRGALRDAIGGFDKKGEWKRFTPDPVDLKKRLTPHARGAVLVAAVFDAFIAIYKARTADLLRIATGGTGIRPGGAIHPDLVQRFADEAAKAAGHVLTMCIRALDYMPPVDITFFEYLRALITADFDIVSDDRFNYRVAFVESFRRRGIYPLNVGVAAADTPRSLSVDTLRWQGLDLEKLPKETRKTIGREYETIIRRLKRYADACFYIKDRRQLFTATREQRRLLHKQLAEAFSSAPEFAGELGLDPARSFEVHELRRALRVGPDGSPRSAGDRRAHAVAGDRRSRGRRASFPRRLDDRRRPVAAAVKYRIFKNINSVDRRARTAAFVQAAAADPLRRAPLRAGSARAVCRAACAGRRLLNRSLRRRSTLTAIVQALRLRRSDNDYRAGFRRRTCGSPLRLRQSVRSVSWRLSRRITRTGSTRRPSGTSRGRGRKCTLRRPTPGFVQSKSRPAAVRRS